MKYYIVDAFSEKLFSGNQAGVCILNSPIDGSTMQNIAAENNLAETAFVLKQEDGYNLRWFTPETEIDLCGHATLGAAFVITEYVDKTTDGVRFHTQSGILTVVRKDNILEMDFPSRPPKPVVITSAMERAIGATILEAHLSRDLMLLLESEEAVRTLSPNMELLKHIPDAMGVIVTAEGETYDFVSRFFAPNVDAMAPEDPVTGSTHCTLIPFWSKRLNKDKLTAFQLSKRGGKLYCENCGDRVKISGHVTPYLEGNIQID